MSLREMIGRMAEDAKKASLFLRKVERARKDAVLTLTASRLLEREEIIRKENGGSKVFFVDTTAITKEGRLQDDVLLMPGDVIIVPERFF